MRDDARVSSGGEIIGGGIERGEVQRKGKEKEKEENRKRGRRKGRRGVLGA